jgi:hypothetical protein
MPASIARCTSVSLGLRSSSFWRTASWIFLWIACARATFSSVASPSVSGEREPF